MAYGRQGGGYTGVIRYRHGFVIGYVEINAYERAFSSKIERFEVFEATCAPPFWKIFRMKSSEETLIHLKRSGRDLGKEVASGCTATTASL
jgi:hypothetical protein